MKSNKNQVASLDWTHDGHEDTEISLFQLEPSYKTDGQEDVSILDHEPSLFVRLVLPSFWFFKIIGISPSSYTFDPNTKKFLHSNGSVFGRVLCVLIGILTTAQTYGTAKLYELLLKNTTILVMTKLLRICYGIFIPTLFYVFFTSGEEFRGIFDFLQQTCRLMCKSGCKFPAKMCSISIGLLVTCITLETIHTLGTIDGRQGLSLYHGPLEYLKTVADAEARVVMGLAGVYNVTEIQAYGFSESGFPFGSVVALAGVSLVLNWIGGMAWTGAIMLNMLWGLMFWLLLHGFFQLVRENPLRNTLEDIRKFNLITSVIDKYNRAFGPVILVCVATGIMYFSVNIFQLFKDGSDVIGKTTAFMAFSWFGLMLLASAQVNKEAANIVEILKARYQNEKLWSKYHGKCIETAQGLILVLYEMQTGSVGLKGLGFFTCTYGFIGTVLSAIATYAIIVIQFQA